MIKYYLYVLVFLSLVSCKKSEIPLADLNYAVVLPVKVDVYSDADCSKFKKLLESNKTYTDRVVAGVSELSGFNSEDFTELIQITHLYHPSDIGSNDADEFSSGDLINVSIEIELMKSISCIHRDEYFEAVNHIKRVMYYMNLSQKSNNFDDLDSVISDLNLLDHIIKMVVKKEVKTSDVLLNSEDWKDLAQLKMSEMFSRYLRSKIIHVKNTHLSEDSIFEKESIESYLLDLESRFVIDGNSFKNQVSYEDISWIKANEHSLIKNIRYGYLGYVTTMCKIYLLKVYLYTEQYRGMHKVYPSEEKVREFLVDEMGVKISYEYAGATIPPLIYYDIFSTDYGKFLIMESEKNRFKTKWSINRDRLSRFYKDRK